MPAPRPTRSSSGAVGGPKWDNPNATVRPEQGLLALRRRLVLFGNLRPVSVHPALVGSAPLRPELLAGVDMLIVRELTGGLYFGQPSEQRTTPAGPRGRRHADVHRAGDRAASVRLAFELARGRRRRLTSVDKANVLSSSRLWRKVVEEIRPEYPDVEVEHRLVDACAMVLVTKPSIFDVLVTENLFGDILSDEASVLAGSLGMLPSASIGDRRTTHGLHGLFEPIHGSAPTSPGATSQTRSARSCPGRCCSAGRWVVSTQPTSSRRPWATALDDGYRTRDLVPAGASDTAALNVVGTVGMTEAILEIIPELRGQHNPAMSRQPTLQARSALYDTTLRDGAEREGLILSLADKLKIARRLDEFGMRDVEGGWPGSNPKDAEFFAAARSMTWRSVATGRLRVDTPPRQPPGIGSEPARAARRWNAGRDDLRQELAAPCRGSVLGATLDENLAHDRGLVAFVRAAGKEVIYDAEHWVDGFRRRTGLRAGDASGRRPRWRADPRALRHERRTLTDDMAAIRASRSAWTV